MKGWRGGGGGGEGVRKGVWGGKHEGDTREHRTDRDLWKD